jgi:hypothetical protein
MSPYDERGHSIEKERIFVMAEASCVRNSRSGLRVRAFLLILLVLLYLVLIPWYHRYREHYFWQTCADVRYLILDKYQGLLEEQGSVPPEEELLSLASRAVEACAPDAVVKEEDGALAVTGLCRAGGTVWIHVTDPEKGSLVITCDAPGHDLVIDHTD